MKRQTDPKPDRNEIHKLQEFLHIKFTHSQNLWIDQEGEDELDIKNLSQVNLWFS